MTRKNMIQQRFRKEMGLLVDLPKQRFGSTNDGNTAGRFFKDILNSGEITGIDPRLITLFSVILHAMSSGFEINIDEFKKYTTKTAQLYVKLYGWYYMPASLHKILIHGADLIKSAILQIGQLSEEAQEAHNKDFRK